MTAEEKKEKTQQQAEKSVSESSDTSTEKKPVAADSNSAEKSPKENRAPAAQEGRKRYGGQSSRPDNRRRGSGRRKKDGKRGRRRSDKERDEFESKIVDLARVTRVMAGGKRMRFRACVLVGDKKGRVGMGVKKGIDVQLAVQKATDQAKKNLIHVKIAKGTIPHTIEQKHKGACVMLKPARVGTGVIAGGPVRVIMELAGVTNVVAKMKGSKNKVSNAHAVILALSKMSSPEDVQKIKQSE